MEISFEKAKRIVEEDKEAQYGQFVDLDMILDRIRSECDVMTGEEAILRFLHELSKRG